MRYAQTLRLMLWLLPMYDVAAIAQTLTPPKIQTVSQTGVSLLDTAFSYSHSDLAIGGLSVSRSYRSGPDTTGGLLGYDWTHNFDIRAVIFPSTSSYPRVEIVIGSTKNVFVGSGTGPFYADNDAIGMKLVYSGHFIFTDREGTVYEFTVGMTNPVISAITYANGYRITVSNVSNKPKLITDNKGYALVFDYGTYGMTAACGYNLSQTYVTTSTTCAGAALKVGYGYTTTALGFPLLASFTDTTNHVTNMGYDADGWMNCLRLPDSSTCQVTNTYDTGHRGRVVKQVMGDGAIWQFACSCSWDGTDEAQAPEPDGTDVYDPRGGHTAYGFYGLGLTSIQDQNNHTTNYSFIGALPEYIQPPEGNRVDFLYNAHQADAGHTFHPKTGSSAAPITPDGKTFPNDPDCNNPITCNLPTTVTDGNGNVTSYSYDPVHGGVLTETKPAGSGGVSQVIRHHYAQRYAWVKNAGGSYVQGATPVWVETDERTCTSGATSGETCTAGAAKEVVTSYDYGPDSGPNNLQLRGKVVTADGKSLRTCFQYDTLGNKIAETSPRAGLATCS